MLTHIDLFSGIGGFALAAQWAGFKTVVFCENDPFCQEVLAAKFGAIADTPIGRLSKQGLRSEDFKSPQQIKGDWPLLIPDIRDFDGRRFRGATLLTGGFPCQPFSCAGKRRGKADDRWLWPEMLRVISEARPAWVLGENVAGIVNMELEQVCVDLEAEGYEVQPLIIPACAVNAPHRRDRVWIIAYNGDGMSRSRGISRKKHSQGFAEWGKAKTSSVISGQNSHAPDTARILPQGCDVREGQGEFGRESWGEPWPEVAACLCRVDDGVPRRVDRLKALGNAIVPAVAYEIIKEIARIETGHDYR